MQDAESGPTATETAHYIERIAKELKGMASSSELSFLGYLLGMVEEEAASVAAGSRSRSAKKAQGSRRSR